MPSGAKKRKAAKKKKEKAASTTSSHTNPHGGYDDSKSQDEKGSDGGEIMSPVHQDHHKNHRHFNEGSEEGDPSAVRSIVAEDKSGERVSSERSLKSGKDSESKNIRIEYVESGKESRDGDDRNSSSSRSSSRSSSSSSSSDDDSRAIEKKQDMKANVSISDSISYTKVVKPVESSSAEETQVAEFSPKPVVPVSGETVGVLESAPMKNVLVSDVIKPGFENGEKKLSTGETDTDLSSKKSEDKIYHMLDASAKSSPSKSESVSNAYEAEELPPSSGYEAQTSNGTQGIKTSETPEPTENQPLVSPAPPVVQKASWLSCCGIFDVITGSSR
ncbi:suppressor protein SRP40-like [Humulus lupulus]|uniref:suppressor protein SRP40-like n=1 Tax=Humulus lupulus TaxID=3486 RepID=UPI002B4040EB|nr:suppressor protein SRP40-like [Humulus lupulus]